MNPSAFWAALEAPVKPKLDDRVYVQERDRDPASEIQRQQAAVNFLRRHAKRLVVFAVPNAARTSATKLRQAREGAIYGATDLVIAWTGGTAFVEFKTGSSMPRDSQIEFLNALAVREHHVAVCRTAEGLAKWLREIGAPVPDLLG